MTNNDIAKVLLAVGAVSPSLASTLLANLSGPVVKAVAVPAVKAIKAKAVVYAKQVPATLEEIRSLEGKRVQFEHSHVVRGGELRLVTGSYATGDFVIGEGKTYIMLKNPTMADDAGKTFGIAWPNGQGKVYKLRLLA
jgi:hypothetical protein